jgi:hypothetical protein
VSIENQAQGVRVVSLADPTMESIRLAAARCAHTLLEIKIKNTIPSAEFFRMKMKSPDRPRRNGASFSPFTAS